MYVCTDENLLCFSAVGDKLRWSGEYAGDDGDEEDSKGSVSATTPTTPNLNFHSFPSNILIVLHLVLSHNVPPTFLPAVWSALQWQQGQFVYGFVFLLISYLITICSLLSVASVQDQQMFWWSSCRWNKACKYTKTNKTHSDWNKYMHAEPILQSFVVICFSFVALRCVLFIYFGSRSDTRPYAQIQCLSGLQQDFHEEWCGTHHLLDSEQPATAVQTIRMAQGKPIFICMTCLFVISRMDSTLLDCK